MTEPLPVGLSGGREPHYKRVFDLGILIASHLLFLPVWLLIWLLVALLIKLDDHGPVLFKQLRVGKGGRTFHMHKFRTMVSNADKMGPAWNLEEDPRVTRIGRLLRRTALDELPSLFNVWRGDLSLVGPRALNVEEHRFLCERISGFEGRLLTKPGLTGLAQLYDRHDDAEVKLRLDLEYVRRMNLWLDLKILILSVLYTIAGKWDRRSGKVGGTVGVKK